MRRRLIVAVVAFAVVVTGCSSGGSSPGETKATTAVAPSTTTTTVPVVPAKLVDRTCDTKVTMKSECYWLEVPEHRGVAGSRTLKLWVAVFTPDGAATDAVPYVYLSGGPGDANSSAWVHGDVRLAGDPRPIVIVDQRSTGRSTPRMQCDGVGDPVDPRLPWAEQLDLLRGRATTCATKLRAERFDLAGYTSIESAADFVDLRKALGFARWDVYGVSYGGRLAGQVYAQDPAGVRSLHLDSPVDSSHLGAASLVARAEAALTRAAKDCAAAASCAAKGDLGANLSRAYERLQATPFITPDGAGKDVVINGDFLFNGVFQLLYRTDLISLLPSAAKAIAGGDTSLLAVLATELTATFDDPLDAPDVALNQAMDCQETGATTADRKVIADPGVWRALVAAWSYPSCAGWGLAPVTLPIPSGDVPVLLTQGELEPVSSPEIGAAIRKAFPKTVQVVLPGGGHGVGFANECLTSITLAFTAAPTVAPDTACVAKLPKAFAG